jgi:hypothetical protein
MGHHNLPEIFGKFVLHPIGTLTSISGPSQGERPSPNLISGGRMSPMHSFGPSLFKSLRRDDSAAPAWAILSAIVARRACNAPRLMLRQDSTVPHAVRQGLLEGVPPPCMVGSRRMCGMDGLAAPIGREPSPFSPDERRPSQSPVQEHVRPISIDRNRTIATRENGTERPAKPCRTGSCGPLRPPLRWTKVMPWVAGVGPAPPIGQVPTTATLFLFG